MKITKIEDLRFKNRPSGFLHDFFFCMFSFSRTNNLKYQLFFIVSDSAVMFFTTAFRINVSENALLCRCVEMTIDHETNANIRQWNTEQLVACIILGILWELLSRHLTCTCISPLNHQDRVKLADHKSPSSLGNYTPTSYDKG